MECIYEPGRQLPVAAEADVIVAGGGPGGLPAAVAAARQGADVLLVERYGFLGGLATAGLVSPILAHTASRATTPIVEGLLREMIERMHSLDGAPTWDEACQSWGIRFDAEAFKRVGDEMIQEAGVDLLLHTLVTDAVVEDGEIVGLVIESKSGRQALLGRVIVDATGDADVAFRAGARTRQGRDFDGSVESMGSFFHIGGIQDLSEKERDQATEKVRQAMAGGRFHFYSAGNFGNFMTWHQDGFAPNMTRAPGDPTDVRDLTRAELSVRQDVWELIGFLRKEVPGLEECYLRHTSPQVSPRESRQVIGDYVLTGEDVHQGRKFEDGIARGSWYIDIHCPLGHTYPVHLCVTECPRGEDCPFWAAEHNSTMRSREEIHPPQGDWYDIPYRCITPKEIDNLMVSGRCISATHQGMASARVMGTCVAIGQAAGTAAYLALQTGVHPREIDVGELRDLLQSDGALV